jgi:hypothetical protein
MGKKLELNVFPSGLTRGVCRLETSPVRILWKDRCPSLLIRAGPLGFSGPWPWHPPRVIRKKQNTTWVLTHMRITGSDPAHYWTRIVLGSHSSQVKKVFLTRFVLNGPGESYSEPGVMTASGVQCSIMAFLWVTTLYLMKPVPVYKESDQISWRYI